jgi:hypothetical protein
MKLMPHLFSAVIVCSLTAAILFVGRMVAIHLATIFFTTALLKADKSIMLR